MELIKKRLIAFALLAALAIFCVVIARFYKKNKMQNLHKTIHTFYRGAGAKITQREKAIMQNMPVYDLVQYCKSKE